MAEGGAPIIGVDVMCVNCGYNLRGLTQGCNCPECGTQIPLDRRPTDPLLSGTLAERAALLWGLTLLSVSAAGAVGLRLGFAVMWALSPRGFIPIWIYIALTMAVSCLWSVGAMLAADHRPLVADSLAGRTRVVAARTSSSARRVI